MSDALLSPAVGGTMFLATAATMTYCVHKIKNEQNSTQIPLMGVLGAFIFAGQMINFTIPLTGSSGHIGGGMLLALLLGPYAAFFVMASILTVQAFFFADGGILALGANIFNLAFFPSFIGYLLIYRPLMAIRTTPFFRSVIITFAVIVSLQLGSFFVVLETLLSQISELGFMSFLAVMQPIHLGIGLVEGIATAAIISVVTKNHSELLHENSSNTGSIIRPIIVFAVAAIITGGIFSWFASSYPDGLEWSIGKVTGAEEIQSKGSEIYQQMAAIQEKTAILPDYGFKSADAVENGDEAIGENADTWPTVDAGTTTAGIVGLALTMLFSVLIGVALRKMKSNVS